MGITKKLFLNALECRTRGWYTRHVGRTQPLTLAEQFRMEQGLEVHRRARDLHPDGKLISDPNTARAAEATSQLMADTSVGTLFEATFQVEGYTAKADILRRQESAWHLIEVKSSVNDKAELVDDLAYTVMVAQRAGCSISRASLLLVSKDYRLGQSDEDLFREVDHTEDGRQRATEFLPLWAEIADAISREERPVPQLVHECRNCEYFARECIGKDVAYPVFDLPRLSRPKVVALAQAGAVRIEDIPDGFALTSNQKQVYEVIISGNPMIGPNLGKTVSSVEWPAHYLDFETVMTAIPLYPGVAPYDQIPTQFSIHVCCEAGQVREHHEFLADPSRDPRPDLVASLVEALGNNGSIVVYSQFEKRRIDDLAKACPHLADELVQCRERLVDLEEIFKKDYCHPNFHGRTSIKQTLPAVVPEMTYDGMAIAHGDSAMAAFARLAQGKYSEQEAEVVRADLLGYCKHDTLAMVKLHERMMEIAQATV